MDGQATRIREGPVPCGRVGPAPHIWLWVVGRRSEPEGRNGCPSAKHARDGGYHRTGPGFASGAGAMGGGHSRLRKARIRARMGEVVHPVTLFKYYGPHVEGFVPLHLCGESCPRAPALPRNLRRRWTRGEAFIPDEVSITTPIETSPQLRLVFALPRRVPGGRAPWSGPEVGCGSAQAHFA